MIENKSSKAITIIVAGLLLLLLLGAIVFYKERMLFLDGGFILYRIINLGTLQIQEHRIGSFITQIVPWLGVKLHLRLGVLMLLYSCSFNLFFLITGLLLLYKYRRYDLAVLLAFYLTLFVSDTYFWTNNEVHQGIMWMFIAFAATTHAIKNKKPAWLTIVLFLVLFTIAVWTHPLVLIVAGFLWFFYWMQGGEWPFTTRQSVFYTALLLLIIASKFTWSSLGGYDSGRMESFEHFNFRHIANIFSTPQALFIFKNCITDYWLFILLFISGMVALLKASKYLLFIWTAIFVGGYFLLICITFKDVDGIRFYMESEYMPLSIIGTAPFVYYLLPRLSANKVTILLTCVFLVRIAYIANSSSFFIRRVAITNTIVEKMREKGYTKIIIPDTNKELDDKLIMNWGTPVETMFISALKGENPQRTAVFMDTAKISKAMSQGPAIIQSCFEMVGDSTLNAEYFNVDTFRNYKITEYRYLLK